MAAIIHLKFKPEPKDGFYLQLRTRVNQYLNQDKTEHNLHYKTSLKAFLLITGFLISGYFVLTAQITNILIIGYLGLGIFTSFIFLNLVHDAVHNCLFKSRKINQIISYFLDVVGANSYIWTIRHVQLHHPYPNVPSYDADVKQSAFVRLNQDDKWRIAHQFQHIYMIGLYFLYTLYWMSVRDFRDYFTNSFANGQKLDIPLKEYIKLFLFKTIYLFNFLILPYLLLDFSFIHILFGFLSMHFIQSAIAITALLSAHVPEDAVFINPNTDGTLPYSWAEHQMLTTVDFATQSTFVNLLYGGFNHHIAHHLFPNLNHLHYPKITKLIIETSKKHGINYYHMKMFEAMKSHFKLLKKQGIKSSDIWDE